MEIINMQMHHYLNNDKGYRALPHTKLKLILCAFQPYIKLNFWILWHISPFLRAGHIYPSTANKQLSNNKMLFQNRMHKGYTRFFPGGGGGGQIYKFLDSGNAVSTVLWVIQGVWWVTAKPRYFCFQKSEYKQLEYKSM